MVVYDEMYLLKITISCIINAFYSEAFGEKEPDIW